MNESISELAAALGRVASGLYIVTARQGDDETGMLASWVQQCSFQPPMISAAVKRHRPITEWLTTDATFAVNILDESQTDMVAHFGRGFEKGQPAFTGLQVERPKPDMVVLANALSYLQCRVIQHLAAGDHDLYLAEVKDGRLLNDGRPMVHIRKNGLNY